jgi:hypothetical protein
MWTWLNTWWGENINQECISFGGSFYESFCSKQQRLGAPRPFCTIEVFLLFRIYMLLTKVLHSRTLCNGVLKWRILVCQSTHGLSKTSQDNPTMTWFLGTSRKPPFFQLRFQFTIIVENDLFDYNFFFSYWPQKLKTTSWKCNYNWKWRPCVNTTQ